MGLPEGARVAVIGAGPCGLGCARELARLGHANWHVYEREASAGGHASSEVDSAGFTWDIGGHVVFSHFGEFDALLREALGDEYYEHERSSYIRFDGRWVPYPFQNNLRYLPPEAAFECLTGLVEAPGGDGNMDFARWMRATFGAGITKHFMEPYNFKVWATPAERMSANWIAERVSVLDYKRALHTLVFQEDDKAWGPNNLFMFPKIGGTGEIYRRAADRLADRISFNREIVSIDPAVHELRFADGSTERYDVLVSTMPVDLLVQALTDCPPDVREAAGRLEHNGVFVVGVGFELPLDDDKSWMYFPDSATPFYRATNFAKYSPAHVPDGDVARYCAYMTETSYSDYKHESRSDLEERVLRGLVASRLVPEDAERSVASVHVIDAPYAYPVPTLERDRALAVIQPWLMEQGIYSRGRFGSWRYEIGNMDHAVKMGIDAARALVRDEPEELWS